MLQRFQVEPLLVAESTVETLAPEPRGRLQIRDARAVVARLPESVHGALEDLLGVEAAGATAHIPVTSSS